jgi:hypothetical protein
MLPLKGETVAVRYTIGDLLCRLALYYSRIFCFYLRCSYVVVVDDGMRVQ